MAKNQETQMKAAMNQMQSELDVMANTIKAECLQKCGEMSLDEKQATVQLMNDFAILFHDQWKKLAGELTMIFHLDEEGSDDGLQS